MDPQLIKLHHAVAGLQQLVKDIDDALEAEALPDALTRIQHDIVQILRVLVREGLAEEREFQTVFDDE